MATKEKQNDSVGIDEEIRNLINTSMDFPEANPFQLPDKREFAELPSKTEAPDQKETEKLDVDLKYARDNIYELIEYGMAAVQDLSHLSRELMHPRTYEVLADLIAKLTKNNLELIELTKSKIEATKKSNPENLPANDQPPVVNNIDQAVFVGSSHELLKILKQQKP